MCGVTHDWRKQYIFISSGAVRQHCVVVDRLWFLCGSLHASNGLNTVSKPSCQPSTLLNAVIHIMCFFCSLPLQTSQDPMVRVELTRWKPHDWDPLPGVCAHTSYMCPHCSHCSLYMAAQMRPLLLLYVVDIVRIPLCTWLPKSIEAVT